MNVHEVYRRVWHRALPFCVAVLACLVAVPFFASATTSSWRDTADVSVALKTSRLPGYTSRSAIAPMGQSCTNKRVLTPVEVGEYMGVTQPIDLCVVSGKRVSVGTDAMGAQYVQFRASNVFYRMSNIRAIYLVPGTDIAVNVRPGVGGGNDRYLAVYNNFSAHVVKNGFSGDGAIYTTDYSFASSMAGRIYPHDGLPVSGGRVMSDGYVGQTGFAVSPNGRFLAYAAQTDDRRDTYHMNLVDLETGVEKIVGVSGFQGFYGNFVWFDQAPYLSVSVSNDGQEVIALDGGTVSYWRADDCQLAPNRLRDNYTECQAATIAPHQYSESDAVDGPTLAYGVNFGTTTDEISLYFGQHYYVLAKPGVHVALLTYLGMGDSFTSGEGDRRRYEPGTDGDANPAAPRNQGVNVSAEKCHLSTASYPYQLAQYMGLQKGLGGFRSVACSGARSVDVVSVEDATYFGQKDVLKSITLQADLDKSKMWAVEDFTPGREAQMAFLSKYRPQVATISIGGNDIGFSDLLKECINPLTECYESDQDRSSIGRLIQGEYATLNATLDAVQRASNTTRYFVVGYPKVAVTTDACKYNALLSRDERQLSNAIVQYLNVVIKKAAESHHMRYVDVEDAFEGHTLCSGSDTLAMNGLSFGNDIKAVGFLPSMFGNESYHPNAFGHELLTKSIKAQLGDLTNYPRCDYVQQNNPDTHCQTVDTPLEAPDIPAAFRLLDVPTPIAFDGSWGTIVQDDIGAGLIDLMKQTLSIAISQDVLFAPLSWIHVVAHSDPVSIGNIAVDANGLAQNTTLALPAGLAPGYHTIHLYGTLATGEQIDMQKRVLVVASMTDIDGDGMPNQTDPCPFVDPAGVDDDDDGIDDACDGVIERRTAVASRVEVGRSASPASAVVPVLHNAANIETRSSAPTVMASENILSAVSVPAARQGNVDVDSTTTSQPSRDVWMVAVVIFGIVLGFVFMLLYAYANSPKNTP